MMIRCAGLQYFFHFNRLFLHVYKFLCWQIASLIWHKILFRGGHVFESLSDLKRPNHLLGDPHFGLLLFRHMYTKSRNLGFFNFYSSSRKATSGCCESPVPHKQKYTIRYQISYSHKLLYTTTTHKMQKRRFNDPILGRFVVLCHQ